MAEVLLHVDDRLALLQQQRRERVPQVVDANLTEFHLLEDACEDVADVPLLKRRAFQRGEHPRRQRLPLLDPPFPLQPAPGEQRLEQLRGHVDPTPLM
ncbi:MAG TPA: hypothetical protein VL225_19990 [Vicinamibacterales bacterium]|nr:hypothetical protein [Vicinamibacterales bacterium]